MQGFGTAEVSKLLGLTRGQIREFARAGFLRAERGSRGEYRFSFQDLVLLRAAKELHAARVSLARINRALRWLQRQLPADRPLSELRITAEGDRIVVRDGRTAWYPESGQLTLDFPVAELTTKIAPLLALRARKSRGNAEPFSAEDWFDFALELEASAPAEARDAYSHCLALNPDYAEALVNLGRLIQAAGRVHEAEDLYRRARTARPDLAVAAFNLGTVLDEQKRSLEAIDAYHAALEADPHLADAHFNLAALYEQEGNAVAAYRHRRRHRELTGKKRR
jgi:tetratricopeptide (TPR) repeat protein